MSQKIKYRVRLTTTFFYFNVFPSESNLSTRSSSFHLEWCQLCGDNDCGGFIQYLINNHIKRNTLKITHIVTTEVWFWLLMTENTKDRVLLQRSQTQSRRKESKKTRCREMLPDILHIKQQMVFSLASFFSRRSFWGSAFGKVPFWLLCMHMPFGHEL